jgi:hypothetical protein
MSKIIACLQRLPLQGWLAAGSQHVCINLKYTNLGSCSESVQVLNHAAGKWLRSTLYTMTERARRPASRSIGSHTRVYR